MDLRKLGMLLACWVCGLGATAAQAQVPGYPSRPIKVINPYVAGGGVDAIFRPLLQKVGENIGQQFVIESHAGANGMIGMALGAKAPPDGYTLVIGTTGSTVMNPALYDSMPYDTQRDLAPITNVAQSPFMLVANPSTGLTDIKGLVALAKSKPGEVSYSSFGIGSSPHLGAEMFSQAAGVKLLHVPYKGSAEAIVAVVSGNTMLGLDSMQSTMPHIRAGKLNPLGIAAAKRSPVAPEVPTIAEQGYPGFEVGSWYALLAPAGTPKPIIDYLNAEVAKALASPDVKQVLDGMGLETIGNSPAAFAAQIGNDLAQWKRVAQAGNIRAPR